jgi:hypothetical protein
MPDKMTECDCYHAGAVPESLPCGGCAYCVRAHHQWSRFTEDVDDVVPLSVKTVKVNPGDDGADSQVNLLGTIGDVPEHSMHNLHTGGTQELLQRGSSRIQSFYRAFCSSCLH